MCERVRRRTVAVGVSVPVGVGVCVRVCDGVGVPVALAEAVMETVVVGELDALGVTCKSRAAVSERASGGVCVSERVDAPWRSACPSPSACPSAWAWA